VTLNLSFQTSKMNFKRVQFFFCWFFGWSY